MPGESLTPVNVSTRGNWSSEVGEPTGSTPTSRTLTGPRSGPGVASGAVTDGGGFVYGQGGYRIPHAKFLALKALSGAIVDDIFEREEELGHSITRAFGDVARAAGMRPYLLRALLRAHMLDDYPDTIAKLRRPRRSTLVALAAALGLPDAIVASWCDRFPDAIAPEAKP